MIPWLSWNLRQQFVSKKLKCLSLKFQFLPSFYNLHPVCLLSVSLPPPHQCVCHCWLNKNSEWDFYPTSSLLTVPDWDPTLWLQTGKISKCIFFFLLFLAHPCNLIRKANKFLKLCFFFLCLFFVFFSSFLSGFNFFFPSILFFFFSVLRSPKFYALVLGKWSFLNSLILLIFLHFFRWGSVCWNPET